MSWSFWMLVTSVGCTSAAALAGWWCRSREDQNTIHSLRRLANERQLDLDGLNERLAQQLVVRDAQERALQELKTQCASLTDQTSQLERRRTELIADESALKLRVSDLEQQLRWAHAKQLRAEAILAYVGAARGDLPTPHNLDHLHQTVTDKCRAVEELAQGRVPTPGGYDENAAFAPGTFVAYYPGRSRGRTDKTASPSINLSDAEQCDMLARQNRQLRRENANLLAAYERARAALERRDNAVRAARAANTCQNTYVSDDVPRERAAVYDTANAATFAGAEPAAELRPGRSDTAKPPTTDAELGA